MLFCVVKKSLFVARVIFMHKIMFFEKLIYTPRLYICQSVFAIICTKVCSLASALQVAPSGTVQQYGKHWKRVDDYGPKWAKPPKKLWESCASEE